MKKFLKKKPVMITFVVLAIAMLAVYIGMLVRPVAVGMTYKGTSIVAGREVEHKYKINDGRTLTYYIGDDKEGTKMWYFTKGYEMVIMEPVSTNELLGMTEEEYKDKVKEYKEKWDNVIGKISTNAFAFGNDDKVTSAGTVVFAVIGGIVTILLLTFAGASVAVSVSTKKSGKKTAKKSKKKK